MRVEGHKRMVETQERVVRGSKHMVGARECMVRVEGCKCVCGWWWPYLLQVMGLRGDSWCYVWVVYENKH
jgi:hypothetical protein